MIDGRDGWWTHRVVAKLAKRKQKIRIEKAGKHR